MRASYQWLKELSGVDASPEEVAERLTAAGLEVEALERFGGDLDGVVVGEVRSREKVQGKDKLSLVTVFDGDGEVQVICGAPNVPDPGGRILFARTGARLPVGFEIGERKIAGVVSRGMICSETELAIGSDEAGIYVFEDGQPGTPGQSAVDAMRLDDVVFEIGLTPNRPDGLGHVGLARELALLSDVPFETPRLPAPARLAKGWAGSVVADSPARFDLTDHWVNAPRESVNATDHKKAVLGGQAVQVTIADPDRCPRYGAALVFGVTIVPSPFWMRYRLHCLGVRAIHNVVDVTNYVLYEWGHPIHAFDLAQVRGRRIDVRLAREGEKMATLDGIERDLTPDDLLICDGEGPVAVAGVMGGANSEISKDTRDVLIECAYFDPRSVRRTGRRLGLHTDASHRFERGVDPGGVPTVLARTAQLVTNLCSGAVENEALDVHPAPVTPPTIHLRHARTTMLNGFETPTARVREILEGLGCAVGESSVGAFDVSVPTWRPDLSREVDLIEEVVRVHGFEHIPTEIPPVRPSAEGTPFHIRFDRRLRTAAAAAGLVEAINYAFVSPADLSRARVPTDAVPLLNPLSEDRSVMRTSLLPGLAAAAGHSQRRQVSRVALFEVGNVFAPAPGEDLPHEDARVGMFAVGPRDAWIGDGDGHDFYDGKGWVEAIVREALGAQCTFVLDDALDDGAPYLHPRRRAAIEVHGLRVGVLGELHPDVADALELEGRPVYADLSVTALRDVAMRIGVPQASALPRFPSVSRDIPMLLVENNRARAIVEHLRTAGGELVEAIELFDLYRGEQVPKGKKSLAFRVIYRDPADTLTDKRVDKAHRRVSQAAETGFGATLR